MAPKKSNTQSTTNTPKKSSRPPQKRDSKHGGKNGKKEGVSGSSFFTWFMVIALLGVWTSVAVVWFDLVDYEEVLGKLGVYDADGDGDFDVDDAKILLGLKERSVLPPSEDSKTDNGDNEHDPGYISDQDLEDALKEDESEHTHDYITDQDLADALDEDEAVHADDIDDQYLADAAEDIVHEATQTQHGEPEDFNLEDAFDDKVEDETAEYDAIEDTPEDLNLVDAIDAAIHEALHSEHVELDEPEEVEELELKDKEAPDSEEPEQIIEEAIVESKLETLAVEELEEELEEEGKETDAITEPEDEPALETVQETPDVDDAEEVVEELYYEAVEEAEEELAAPEETIDEQEGDDATEPETEAPEESEVEKDDTEAEVLANEEYEINAEDEDTHESIEAEYVHTDEEPKETELVDEEPAPEPIEENILNDIEETLYDNVPENEQDEVVISDNEEQFEDEQVTQTEEQIESKTIDIDEKPAVDNRPTEDAREENTLANQQEEQEGEPAAGDKETESKEKAKKKKLKLLNKFDKTIKVELNAAEKLRKKGKVDEALRAFESLVNKYPQSPKARYGKAQSEDDLAEKRRSNDILLKAINTYEEVTGLPNVPADLVKLSLQRRANRQQFLGRMRGSLLTLQKLVQLYPDDVSLKNDLGVGYLLIGDNNKAKQVYEEVLAIDSNNGFAKVHYGFILKTDNKIAESVPYLKDGLESEEPGTDDGRFYFHLGDAYQRIGNKEEAYKWYEAGHKKGHFASLWQRSLYNVNGLKAQPWWTAKETGYTDLVKTLEANWKVIRDEGLAVMDQTKGLFLPEDENLREKGDWSQYTLWQRGQKNEKSCKNSPRTCSLLERFPESSGCRRGQIKYSVMHPGTHVWPHTGPTNCRLRMHLGLVIPKEGCKIRCANDTRTWYEGKVLIFDDSFEHEVWQDANSYRLIFIVDVWHPDLTPHQRQTLPAI
ncbi:aspartyl asparaginyl beta-hydroxylase isoform X4 [Pelobates cultripes]|uniref:Aspartyl asparaginyl beta-hydroxylase isoform X4 n=1 Tax=Pelobates cultripes TaxID=61616 RepID=A0AAD1S1D3_PELCU|nr:aspartyl asparaginyl beta-hydroxylase isoform X4 [Pelobates cultripes]